MHFYRVPVGGETHLVVRTDEGTYDLTAGTPSVSSFFTLAQAGRITDQSIVHLTNGLLDSAPRIERPLDVIELPFSPQEVWAAGVTYQISEEAREAESGIPDVYMNVFESDRPELFFKATPSRLVGPDEPVGIRADSHWNVPEPELGIVLCDGELSGFTIGNDMSSRSIEGENPLYLPQAKVYEKSCSIGPCVVPFDAIPDPHDLAMEMRITREGTIVFNGSASTSEMVRTCEELVSYLVRHNPLPERAVLLTGTSIVPPDSFSLQPNDRIDISIEGIGRLSNTTITV